MQTSLRADEAIFCCSVVVVVVVVVVAVAVAFVSSLLRVGFHSGRLIRYRPQIDLCAAIDYSRKSSGDSFVWV